MSKTSLILIVGFSTILSACAVATVDGEGDGAGGTASATGGGAGADGSGGATSGTGGATSSTGGATSSTGGATSSTGGATSSTGGATSSTGGATSSTGGTTAVGPGDCSGTCEDWSTFGYSNLTVTGNCVTQDAVDYNVVTGGYHLECPPDPAGRATWCNASHGEYELCP